MLLTPSGALFRTAEGRSTLVRGLDTLVQSAGPLGPVVFVLIYTLGVLFLPATPFTIAGAVIFGKFHGMLYDLTGGCARGLDLILPGEVLPSRSRPRFLRVQDAVARPEGGR